MDESGNLGDDRSIVNRAFSILSCFSAQDTELALVDLVERTGLPKATLHRLAGQLVEVGALQRVGRRYRLGLRLFELASVVWAQRVLREVAVPYMQDLYELTHETIQLGWFDLGEVLYVDRIRGHSSISVPTFTGGRMPAYCTALGKSMLAFSGQSTLRSVMSKGLRPLSPHTITVPRLLLSELVKIRETRIAFDREEAVRGLGCVASPILDPAGRAVAAVSVSAPAPRIKALRIEKAVREAASGIAEALYSNYVDTLADPRHFAHAMAR